MHINIALNNRDFSADGTVEELRLIVQALEPVLLLQGDRGKAILDRLWACLEDTGAFTGYLVDVPVERRIL